MSINTNWEGKVQGGPAIPVYPVGGETSTPVPVTGNLSESWRVTPLNDRRVDLSDKTFVVPAGEEWEILWIWVKLSTQVNAGNRQLAIQILDASGNVLATLARAGVTQPISTVRYYLFAPGAPDQLAFRDTDHITVTLPVTSFLSAGQRLRIYDNKAIAPVNDDMTIELQIAKRTL